MTLTAIAFSLVVLTPDAASSAAPLLTLEDAQALARDSNFDAQTAHERMARAQILSKKAWAFLMPVVTASGTITRNSDDISFAFGGVPPELEPLFTANGIPIPQAIPITIQKLWQKSAQVAFSWTLLNGRAVPLIQNAYSAAEAASYGYAQVRESLTYATALSYYNLLSAERQVAIRARALDIALANLKLAQARVEVGQTTRVDALRAEVEVATAEQLLVQSQNAAVISQRALATLINRVEKDGSVAAFRVERPPEQRVVPTDVLGDALEQRLDLKIGALQLEMAERSKTETWMQFLPSLNANGAYRWNEASGFGGEKETWQVNLSLNWTLFEGLSSYWELQERQHDIHIAELAIDKTRVEIAQQVADAKLNLDSAVANHNAAKRRAELAAKSATLVAAQFEVGAATQLDALDANRALADAETAEALGQLGVDLAYISVTNVTRVPPPGAP